MNSHNSTEVIGSETRDQVYAQSPYVHLAFVNAVQLSPYALLPLSKASTETEGKSSTDLDPSAWQLSLKMLARLPQRQLPQSSASVPPSLPCICLLPPQWAQLDTTVAAALEPQLLRRQGLEPINLEDYSETALLKAIKQGVEIFYPQAFRPDATIKSLEKYLDWLDKAEGPIGGPDQSAQAAATAEKPFREDIGLPLAMRFDQRHLDSKQVLLPENLTSRQIHCYWIEGDSPLLSLTLTAELYKRHHRYAAELSFSDIYPQGLVPVLFQAAILPSLWHLKQDQRLQNGNGDLDAKDPSGDKKSSQTMAKSRSMSILAIAERDMNLFAAEPLLADKDYRLLRLELRASNKRQFLTLQNLYNSLNTELGLEASSPDILPKILEWIETSPKSLHSLPRYFPIQISALCPQRCGYCPYPKILGPEFFPPQSMELRELPNQSKAAYMPRLLWCELLASIADFAGDAVINLSPLGEPLLHPEFVSLVGDLLAHPELELVIETSGTFWQASEILQILQLDSKQGRISWIISLDALDPQLYKQLRAPDEDISPLTGLTASQHKAHQLLELLLSSDDILPHQVYVQAVRMKDNEDDLEAFYRYWAEGRMPSSGWAAQAQAPQSTKPSQPSKPSKPSKRPQVIIQKYNSYAGLLPERQLLRLDPVERFPCRRLAREMVFGLNGQAYLCVQDLEQHLAQHLKLDRTLGCFPAQSLEQLWHCSHSLYQQHIDGNYPSLCRNCDEYYIYNF